MLLILQLILHLMLLTILMNKDCYVTMQQQDNHWQLAQTLIQDYHPLFNLFSQLKLKLKICAWEMLPNFLQIVTKLMIVSYGILEILVLLPLLTIQRIFIQIQEILQSQLHSHWEQRLIPSQKQQKSTKYQLHLFQMLFLNVMMIMMVWLL